MGVACYCKFYNIAHCLHFRKIICIDIGLNIILFSNKTLVWPCSRMTFVSSVVYSDIY